MPLLDFNEIAGAVQEDGPAIDEELPNNRSRAAGTQEFPRLTTRGQKLWLKLSASLAKQNDLLVRANPNIGDLGELSGPGPNKRSLVRESRLHFEHPSLFVEDEGKAIRAYLLPNHVELLEKSALVWGHCAFTVSTQRRYIEESR